MAGEGAGTTPAALAAQQTGDLGDQFAGDVERGTIGDLVGSLPGLGSVLVVRTPYRGPHARVGTVWIIRNIRVVGTTSHFSLRSAHWSDRYPQVRGPQERLHGPGTPRLKRIAGRPGRVG